MRKDGLPSVILYSNIIFLEKKTEVSLSPEWHCLSSEVRVALWPRPRPGSASVVTCGMSSSSSQTNFMQFYHVKEQNCPSMLPVQLKKRTPLFLPCFVFCACLLCCYRWRCHRRCFYYDYGYCYCCCPIGVVVNLVVAHCYIDTCWAGMSYDYKQNGHRCLGNSMGCNWSGAFWKKKVLEFAVSFYETHFF